jgi:hypothetical protein
MQTPMRRARKQRVLAPVVVERMVAGVACVVLVPVALAIAAAGDGLRLVALDFGFVLAAGAALVWGLRRQLWKRIAGAPEAPPGAALAGDRTTVWREMRILLPLAVLLALSAEFGGGAESLLCGMGGALLVWNALDLRRWERRAGTRIYRERRLWARGAPFFYLVRVERLAESEG